MKFTSRFAIAAALAASFMQVNSIRAQAQIDTLVLRGGQAPNLGVGITLDQFDAPSINEAGQVAFYSRVMGSGITTTNREVMYAGEPGDWRIVYRGGDAIPSLGSGASFFNNVFVSTWNQSPVINDVGEACFITRLAWPEMGIVNYALFSESNGNYELITYIGDLIPNSTNETVLSFTSGPAIQNTYVPTINANGDIAYLANITGPGVDEFSDRGFFIEKAGVVGKVVREGDIFPSDPVAQLVVDQNVMQSDAGHIAIWSSHLLSGPTSAPYGIYVGIPGSILPVMQSLAPVPDVDGDFRFWFPQAPALNSNGQTAFTASFFPASNQNDLRQGVFKGVRGALQKVVVEGETVEGVDPTTVLDTPTSFSVVLNSNNHVAFFGELTGPNVTSNNSSAIFSDVGGSIGIVAREGEPAPGLNPPVVFSQFGGSPLIDGITNTVCMNDNDQIAFLARTRGTDGSTGPMGIWVAQPDGQLELVVAGNMTIDVNEHPQVDDLRTVALTNSISMIQGSGGGDGRRKCLTADGRIAFRLSFTDLSSGLFIAQVPTPGCSCLGDVSSDSVIDGLDLQMFVSCLVANSGGECGCADVNNDEAVDTNDIEPFVSVLVGGANCQ